MRDEVEHLVSIGVTREGAERLEAKWADARPLGIPWAFPFELYGPRPRQTRAAW